VSLSSPPLVSSTAHNTPGASDAWGTPQSLFDLLDSRWGFVLDAAASASNAKCERFYTEDDDALSLSWRVDDGLAPVFVNPPYGRAVGLWVEKAFKESRQGLVVCMLIFCRTDTKWWHRWAMRAAEVSLIKGRVRFERDGVAQQAAPAPSCVVTFAPWWSGPPVLRTLDLNP